MELKELRWFLVLAEEGNMTRAAEQLHITQPTLSKQMKALEIELHQKLFIRQSAGIRLTDEGQLLREEAADVIALADRMESRFISLSHLESGSLYFGLAESCQIRHLAAEVKHLKEECPGLEYHVISGVSMQVTDKLDKGIIDFAVLAEKPDETKYEWLPFLEKDRWGLVMPADCMLVKKEAVTFDDLIGLPLLCSAQAWKRDIPRWCGKRFKRLRLEGSFGLAYNGAVFVKEGLGYLLALDNIVNTSEGSGLAFRPLTPVLETTLYLTWRRNGSLSPVARRFLDLARESFQNITRRKE